MKTGDLQWALSKALYGAGNYREAKKAAELLKSRYPKHGKVESKDVDAFMANCDASASRKNPPPDEGDPYNQLWDWIKG